jgi:hypothetical protein
MQLDIGFGMVREDGETYYRTTEPQGNWQAGGDFTDLMQTLREKHGIITVTISAGLMKERFRYTVWEMPWEEGEI